MITTDYDAQIAAIEADTSELPQPNGTEEEYCTINLDTREVTIPDCFKTIAVYSDHRAETLWFTCDRYFDNTDLGDATVGAAIIYQGANGIYGKDYAVYKAVMKADDEKIIFGWTIQDSATQSEGELVFGLRLYQVDENGVFTYKLNTKVNHITIEHGLDYVYDSMDSSTADAVDMLAARVAALESIIGMDEGGKGLLEMYNFFGECTDATNDMIKNVTIDHLGSTIPDGTNIRVRFINPVKLRHQLETGSEEYLKIDVNGSGAKQVLLSDDDFIAFPVDRRMTGPNSVLSFTYNDAFNSGDGEWRLEGGDVINALWATEAALADAVVDDAIKEASLANQAVTTAKIANNAVTNAKIANNAVDSDKILDLSVTTNKLAGNAVTTEKIANGAVTKAKLTNELKRLADAFDFDDTISTNTKLVVSNDDADTVNFEPIVEFLNEVRFNAGGTTYMNTDLVIESRHTLTVNGDTVLGDSSTDTIQFGTGAAYTTAQINEVLYQPVETISTATASITAANNTEYRCSENLTSLTLDYPSDLTSSSKFGALIYFKTGSAALAINYVKPLVLSGSDVTSETVSGQTVYIFDPQPNMKYTLGLMWDGEVMNGVIRGVEYVTTTEEVETNGNTD